MIMRSMTVSSAKFFLNYFKRNGIDGIGIDEAFKIDYKR